MADSFITRADGFGHIDKDPGSALFYTWNLTDWLVKAGNPTITGVAVTADSGLTVDGSPAVTAGYVSQKFSGGTAGQSYFAKLVATMSNGEVKVRRIVLDVMLK